MYNDSLVLPMEEEWDYIIILDACRFDFFKKVYRDYLEGDLTKRFSPSTWTFEWASKVFTDVYTDVIYISGNTFIRNRAASGSEIVEKFSYTRPVNLFISEEHFHRILDVWNNCWDYHLNTVHPSKMNEASLYALKEYPKKRLIIHYMQPHTPYILARARWMDRKSLFIIHRLAALLGWEKSLEIMRTFGLRSHVIKLLRRLYEENLRLALEHVTNLVDYIEGKIIITSDHGELLGENGSYGHAPQCSETRHKKLIEIPWLEIQRDKALKDLPENLSYDETYLLPNEEELIKKRLRALGYIE